MARRERLSERIVTLPAPELGAVKVRLRKPGSEETYATAATVRRDDQAGDVFYAWRATTGIAGTHERYTGAVLAAARHIEETEVSL